MNSATPVLTICRCSLAFIWIYQGIVPKWLGPHADELSMNMLAGFTPEQAPVISYIAGTVEVLLGLGILLFHRQRWPYAVSAVFIAGLYLFTVVMASQFLVSAFNATTVNLAVFALSVIALVELRRVEAGANGRKR
ncbi:DoxX-like family protein [Marinobacter sp. LN3S78]|uniref:DoxX-like family protein n=1 Tax=Marinobacter sp. LN3S78 TaxID=3382300 RepID=UPI00387AA737